VKLFEKLSSVEPLPRFSARLLLFVDVMDVLKSLMVMS